MGAYPGGLLDAELQFLTPVQFRKAFKEGIRDGRITCSFRLWKTPQAKAGGRYNIRPFGAIEVTKLRQISARSLRRADATAAGFESVADMIEQLGAARDAQLTRVDFRYLGSASVKQPDTGVPVEPELTTLVEKVRAFDTRSGRGPWAVAALAMIEAHPGRRAPDLAGMIGWETAPFKANVRKLKGLGLTQSLEVGYRLTPRGEAVRSRLNDDS